MSGAAGGSGLIATTSVAPHFLFGNLSPHLLKAHQIWGIIYQGKRLG